MSCYSLIHGTLSTVLFGLSMSLGDTLIAVVLTTLTDFLLYGVAEGSMQFICTMIVHAT